MRGLRRFAILGLLLVMSGAFSACVVGCGKTDEPPTERQAPPPDPVGGDSEADPD